MTVSPCPWFFPLAHGFTYKILSAVFYRHWFAFGRFLAMLEMTNNHSLFFSYIFLREAIIMSQLVIPIPPQAGEDLPKASGFEPCLFFLCFVCK